MPVVRMDNVGIVVDDLHDVVARLGERHGATLVGEIVDYEDAYRLCYVRAPEGFMVGLAQPLGGDS